MFTVCAYLTRRWLETPLPVRGTGYMYGVSYREGCLAVQNHGQETLLPVRGTGYMYGVSYREGCLAVQNHGQEMQNLLETTREQNR